MSLMSKQSSLHILVSLKQNVFLLNFRNNITTTHFRIYFEKLLGWCVDGEQTFWQVWTVCCVKLALMDPLHEVWELAEGNLPWEQLK